MATVDAVPRLSVRKTLSHPVDPARVIGFEARDTVYGLDAILLKVPELPQIRDGPVVSHVVLPTALADDIENSNTFGYLLDDHYLYACDSSVLDGQPVHTGEKYGQSLTGTKVPLTELRTWPASAVEVVVG